MYMGSKRRQEAFGIRIRDEIYFTFSPAGLPSLRTQRLRALRTKKTPRLKTRAAAQTLKTASTRFPWDSPIGCCVVWLFGCSQLQPPPA